MLMENTYGNDTKDIRKHFKKVKETFGGVHGLGADRFQRLLSCFAPDAAQLTETCSGLAKPTKKQNGRFLLTPFFPTHNSIR
jgi:hypothetical protein